MAPTLPSPAGGQTKWLSSLVDVLIAVHVVAFLVWVYLATFSNKGKKKASHQD